MSAHTCTELTDGCYRCDLNRDEMRAMVEEVRAEAEAAWLAYRDRYQKSRPWADAKRLGRQMRRRDFIAGYLAASEIEEVTP